MPLPWGANNNYWNNPNAYGSGYTSVPSNTTVNGVSNSEQNNPSGEGSDWWMDLMRLGLQWKQYQNSQRPPQFAQVPMSPEQQQAWRLYIKSLTNPALANNAAQVNTTAQQIGQSYSGLGWQSPNTIHNRGGVGYSGSQANTQYPAPATQSTRTPDVRGSAIPPGTNVPAPVIRGQSQKPGDSGEMRPGFNRALPEGGGGEAIAEAPRMPVAWGRNTNVMTPGNYPGVTAGGSMFSPGNTPGAQPGSSAPTPGLEYGSPEDARKQMAEFAAFLRSQGVRNAGLIASGWLSGGLVGAAAASAKILWDRFTGNRGGGKP